MKNQSLESSYSFCLDLAKKHYENFPVASILIPPNKRKHIAAVYVFARIADDIADESNLSSKNRIALLIKYRDLFQNRLHTAEYPHLIAVYNTIDSNNLTEKNFLDLINAFIQDNEKNKYTSLKDLLDYCSKSANPVGRILLELFEIRNEKAMEYSDSICTALQLTNFCQDLGTDIQRDRFYIPEEILSKYQLSYNDLKTFQSTQVVNKNFQLMMNFLIDYINDLFVEGKNLLPYLDGLFKFEIKMTIYGGVQILSKIKEYDLNPFKHRPHLTKNDWAKILLKSFF